MAPPEPRPPARRLRRCLALALTGLLVAPALAAAVTASPSADGLPGTPKLQKLINGLLFWGPLLALGALIIAAAAWAFGSHSNNYGAASAGRRGVMIAALAAVLMGFGPALVTWAFELGKA